MTCFAHVECSHSRCFHQAVEYVELDLGGLDFRYHFESFNCKKV